MNLMNPLSKNMFPSIYKLVKMELCSNHEADQAVLNKYPIHWLHGGPTILWQSDCFFLSRNASNMHGGFISKKYVSKYTKISEIGAMLCH